MQGCVCKCSCVVCIYVYRGKLKMSWSVTSSFSHWDKVSNWARSLTGSQQAPELRLSPLTQLPELVIGMWLHWASTWPLYMGCCGSKLMSSSILSKLSYQMDHLLRPHYRLFWEVTVDKLQCFIVSCAFFAKRTDLSGKLGFDCS